MACSEQILTHIALDLRLTACQRGFAVGFTTAAALVHELMEARDDKQLPFRRREGAMARFRDIKTLQKFTSAHASIHNHFNNDRHLCRRAKFKEDRSAALAEWRELAA